MKEDVQGQSCGGEERERVSVALVILFTFAGLACFWGLDAGPPLSDHEAIVSQCARQMRQSGHWLIPYFNEVPFIRKPPLQTWLVAGGSYVVDPPNQDLPVSVLAARLPSALAAMLTVVVVYVLSRFMFGSRTGLVAGGIMACCGGTLFFSHNAQTEMLLAFLTTAALACFYRGVTGVGSRRAYLAGFYVCLGLAMLAKAPLPLALVGLPLAGYWFVTMPLAQVAGSEARTRSFAAELGAAAVGQVRRLNALWLVPGVLIFLALTVPWPLYVYLKVDHALALWRTEFVDRYVGLLSDKVQPPWYYVPLLFAMTVPFCLSIPEALASPFRRSFKAERPGLLFALTWVVLQVAFLSTSAFKRPHYLLPALPGMCVLLSPVIDRLFLGAGRLERRWARLAVLLIAAALVVATPLAVYAVGMDEPELLWAAYPAAVILLAGVVLAGFFFWHGKRQASLFTLFVMPVAIFAWVWSSLGRCGYDSGEVKVAQRLKTLSIGVDDKVTYAVGRPDARLSYYAGIRIHPLYTPLEMAVRRRGRLDAPMDILLEGGQRIADRLRSDQEEYFIFEAKNLAMFKQFFDVEYTEVLRIETEWDKPGEALVVITNKWNTGEEEDWKATMRTTPPVFESPKRGRSMTAPAQRRSHARDNDPSRRTASAVPQGCVSASETWG